MKLNRLALSAALAAGLTATTARADSRPVVIPTVVHVALPVPQVRVEVPATPVYVPPQPAPVVVTPAPVQYADNRYEGGWRDDRGWRDGRGWRDDRGWRRHAWHEYEERAEERAQQEEIRLQQERDAFIQRWGWNPHRMAWFDQHQAQERAAFAQDEANRRQEFAERLAYGHGRGHHRDFDDDEG